MRLNKNQIEHMAFVIVRNLLKEEKIISDDRNKLTDSLMNLITEEFQKEDKLDQEVREILSVHMEKIRSDYVQDDQNKISQRKGYGAVTKRLSREKINFLARQVLNSLFENDEVEFLFEPNEIRLSVVKSIEEELKLYDLIDKRAIDKIQSQKKAIEEGSREWEILYRKYYNEEISKLGKILE
jgi:hypothetical protein